MINLENFADFLAWERATEDTIDFKKTYVDIAGDLIAGLMLSQIIYWHLPNKQGGSKLRVKKDGYTWIAKGHADWYEEIRVTEWQAPRALKILEDKKIIEKKIHRFNGSPTMHIRIIEKNFLSAISKLVNDPNGNEGKTRNQTSERPETLTETTSETTNKEGKILPPMGLYENCLAIHKAKKGKSVVNKDAYSRMISKFEAIGVTEADYSAAIDAMDADPRYTGTQPTSYESWAINIAKERLYPKPTKRKQGHDMAKTFEGAIKLAREMDRKIEQGLL
jgi:hypothetical protein